MRITDTSLIACFESFTSDEIDTSFRDVDKDISSTNVGHMCPESFFVKNSTIDHGIRVDQESIMIISRCDWHECVMSHGREIPLFVSRCEIIFSWHDPYLIKMDCLISPIHLTMEQSWTSRHDLHTSRTDCRTSSMRILVRDSSRENEGNNLHIFMRMHTKSLMSRYEVIIEDKIGRASCRERV